MWPAARMRPEETSARFSSELSTTLKPRDSVQNSSSTEMSGSDVANAAVVPPHMAMAGDELVRTRPTIPASIARHVGARVFVGACIREGVGSRFRMELKELEVLRTGDRGADAKALTTAIFAEFERWIRAHPEQWMWWNTRWLKEGESAAADAPQPSA